MATLVRFFRRRRRQPKGGATPKSSFFSPVGSQLTPAGEPFFTPATTLVQTKLTVNQPSDAHEQEADRMAEHVVQRTAMKTDEDKMQRTAMKTDEEKVQRRGKHEDDNVQCKAEHDEEKIQKKDAKDEEKPIQKKTTATAASSAAPVSAHQIHSTKGQGSALSTGTLAEMSQAFNHDFQSVRIHTTSQAEQLSEGLQAQAFTHGKDIYFNAGKYNPETTDGKRLLAHELTHVVQQSSSESHDIQRYPVPGSLACNEVVDWLNANSPYAPEWAETRCTYSFSNVRVNTRALPDGTVRATVTGSPSLSVTKACPIDSPNWSPTARPNRAAELAAWNSMKTTLAAHEQRHRQIGEQQRVAMQTSFRAINITVTGADQADAMQQAQQRVADLQQQWTQDAQAAQDAIDPFRGAVLTCP